MQSISQSVGQGGVNQVQDVECVQRLLNVHQTQLGLAKPLSVDGRIGPNTLEAIELYQSRVMKSASPDRRVDPNGPTWRSLSGGQTVVSSTASNLVMGRTAGVNAGLIKYLEDVANHYNKPIRVTSGKRSSTEQAEAMWSGWGQHLDRGRIYVYLKNNETVRKELDKYFETAHQASATFAAKQKAKQDFVNKIVGLAGQISKHLTGEAVDIGLDTDPKVLTALGVGLHHLVEKSQGIIKCHHFDTGKLGSAPKATAEIVAKWPAR